jgi:hypothetical protein
MLLHLYFLVAEVPGKCQVGSAAIEQYFGIHVNVAKVEGTFYMVWNISWTFSFMVAWSCNRDLDIPAENHTHGIRYERSHHHAGTIPTTQLRFPVMGQHKALL